MKWRAMRLGAIEGSQDVEDIRRLAGAIGIKTAQEVMDLVLAFYPAPHDRAEDPVRTRRDFRSVRKGRERARDIAMTRRPRTLLEVSQRAKSAEQAFDPELREFVDVFHSEPDGRQPALAERPEPLDALRDAYIAAVAEHLARSFALPVPPWSETHGHGLTRPFFAGGLESLKAILTVESPAAFRRRLLFVSKDALSRPRSAQRNATFTTS